MMMRCVVRYYTKKTTVRIMSEVNPVKKGFCIVLALLICFCAACAAAADSEGEDGGFRWKLEKGTLTITGSGKLKAEGSWASSVKEITALAFEGENLEIDCSFAGYKSLKTIRLGKGVCRTGDDVFRGAGKKIKLIVEDNGYQWNCLSYDPETITKIELGEGTDGFIVTDGFVLDQSGETLLMCYGKKKDVVKIPENVKKLSRGVFSGNQMKELRVPPGLEEIGESAFENCTSLKQITVPASVRSIGKNAFQGCERMNALIFANLDMKTDGEDDPDRYYGLNALKELVIPNYGDISRIDVSECGSLEYIIVSEGNTKLNGESGCLYDETCEKLKGVYLPRSLEDISVYNLPLQSGVRLYVVEGSYAHQFAEQNNYPYSLVTPVSKIFLNVEDVDMKVGKIATLKVSIKPTEGTTELVQWISTDERVATVKDGKVKSVGEGKCDIICRSADCEGKTAVCHIRVYK